MVSHIMIHLLFLSFRGFCYFNNVAIAARLLRMKLAVDRVLIVDWVSLVHSISWIVWHVLKKKAA